MMRFSDDVYKIKRFMVGYELCKMFRIYIFVSVLMWLSLNVDVKCIEVKRKLVFNV